MCVCVFIYNCLFCRWKSAVGLVLTAAQALHGWTSYLAGAVRGQAQGDSRTRRPVEPEKDPRLGSPCGPTLAASGTHLPGWAR